TERGFRTGWIQLSEGPQRKRSKRRSTPHKQRKAVKMNHPIISIGRKEWYAMKRDLREWLVLMPIAFFFIFGLIGFFTSGGTVSLSFLREYADITWPVGQGILLLLFSLSNGTIAASSIGREGKATWILRTLP